MHNEINAWQHFLNLLYKESLMRNVTETFLQVLSAPVTTANEEKKTSKVKQVFPTLRVPVRESGSMTSEQRVLVSFQNMLMKL